MAGLLALGRAAVVSHTSGCVVHQLGLVTPPPMDVTLTCAGGGTHRGTGLNVHSCELRGDEVTIQDLVPVTSLARTVLDSSRVLPFRDAVAVADQAIARDPELPDALSQLLHRYHSWPGINAASRVIAFADGRAGSVGESLSRVSFDEMGLPRPDLQVEFYDENGFIGRTDFYWRQFRTIGEFDGRLKYETVASLYAEKLREDRLRVHDEVVRFGMTDITRDKPALRRRLLAAFERGRLRPPAPQRAPWWP